MVVPHLAFLDIGFQEAFLICVVALLLFGGKLPDVMRQVGRTVGELKRQAQRLTRDLHSEIDRPSLKIEPPKAAIAREPKYPAGPTALPTDSASTTPAAPASPVPPSNDATTPPDSASGDSSNSASKT
ncbi:MAG: twin-arginine translocase TatA/TatE family subunit [Planctomycetes bacterium]|nr:twin-arginine translocase TatA/TatE family subunit [Planctomycetota bacterium]